MILNSRPNSINRPLPVGLDRFDAAVFACRIGGAQMALQSMISEGFAANYIAKPAFFNSLIGR